ncbi:MULTISPECIES: hypothetical protein [unclassified Streptomyces]|uniref:hypothetical protein n=1 Tax=unclassified Streptomyces TaxID=2593676 RepID=UPI001F51C0DB|nr:hypothetical protein [Streptomyces sp. CB01883]
MASRSRSRGKNSEVLARRKAALERAASRMAGERRAAAQAEAERLRREAAFDELAADFELAVQDEQTVAAEVEEEVRRVRERGQARIDEARVAAARVVLAMGEAGETVAGCGRRLGVGTERVKELRRLGREAAGGAAQKSPEKVRGPQRTTAAEELGAERRESARAAAGPAAGGPAERAAAPAPGVAPVTAPVPVAAPLMPAVGPSGAPGPVGGARPEWRE